MNSIILNNAAIRLNDGLYSLNDLHKAAGGEAKHQPARFLRNEQTVALITELAKYPNLGNSLKTVLGTKGGTYACKELVYAYAMWISAAFTLTVIRAFDAIHAPKAKKPTKAPRALAAPASIKDRDQLSFTVREASGRLNNWHLPNPQANWHDGIEAGKAMFAQVEQLALHNVEQAKDAIVFALASAKEFNHGDSAFSNRGRGEEIGFVKALADGLFKCTASRQLSMI